MKIQVFTRSMNDLLFQRMVSFIPADIEVIRCPQFQGQSSDEAAQFLYHVIDSAIGWAVVCDEDCYMNWDEVFRYAKRLKISKSYQAAGMRDWTTAHDGRPFHPLTLNPFFNILDTAKIRKKKAKNGLTWEEISKSYKMDEGYNYEPFYGFYRWLDSSVYVQYLFTDKVIIDGMADGLATSLKYADGDKLSELCVHSWYSRGYGLDSAHTKRIDKIYTQCKKKYPIYRSL